MESPPNEADYQLQRWNCGWDGSQVSSPTPNVGIEEQTVHWDYSNIDLDEAVKRHKVKQNKETVVNVSPGGRVQVIDTIRQSPEQELSPLSPTKKVPRRFWPESWNAQDLGAFDSPDDNQPASNTKWRILE